MNDATSCQEKKCVFVVPPHLGHGAIGNDGVFSVVGSPPERELAHWVAERETASWVAAEREPDRELIVHFLPAEGLPKTPVAGRAREEIVQTGEQPEVHAG